MTLLLVLFVVVKIRFCLFWVFLRLQVFLLVLPHNSKIILKVCIFQGKEVNELSRTDQHPPPPFLTAPFMVITYIRFRFPFFMKKNHLDPNYELPVRRRFLLELQSPQKLAQLVLAHVRYGATQADFPYSEQSEIESLQVGAKITIFRICWMW